MITQKQNIQPDKNDEPEKKELVVPEIIQKAEAVEQETTNDNLIKISESSGFKKYFKMLKFGIPPQAVKLKMKSEGVDSNVLDNPDLMIEKSPEDDEEEQ